jgi:hypothetical protein
MAELLRAASAGYREATICTIQENATKSPVNYDQKVWLSRAVGIANLHFTEYRSSNWIVLATVLSNPALHASANSTRTSSILL